MSFLTKKNISIAIVVLVCVALISVALYFVFRKDNMVSHDLLNLHDVEYVQKPTPIIKQNSSNPTSTKKEPIHIIDNWKNDDVDDWKYLNNSPIFSEENKTSEQYNKIMKEINTFNDGLDIISGHMKINPKVKEELNQSISQQLSTLMNSDEYNLLISQNDFNRNFSALVSFTKNLDVNNINKIKKIINDIIKLLEKYKNSF